MSTSSPSAIESSVPSAPPRRSLVRLVRVMSVDREQTNTEECGGMSVRVRAYTFFAIPYSDVRAVCDRGVVEYRVFRRWNR